MLHHLGKRRLAFCLALLLLPVTALALAVGAAPAHARDIATYSVLPKATVPQASPPATSASSYALLDPESGSFLAESGADERRPMASTTKIMTALVVLERLSLDDTVTVPAEACGVEGSSIYLYEGERITVRTLLYALLLSSANDAAAALALHTAGSMEGFAALMNQKAAVLGLENTHFCNPHGLHDAEHYTTARELAQITAAAMQNPTFAEIVATKRYSAPQNGTDATRLFLNHNKLLSRLEGAVGVKTGFTKASGRCLVSAARRDGLLLIAVTLHDPDDWRDHAALLEWGFSQYVAFAPAPTPITVPVVGGTAGEVQLTPARAFRTTLPATHGEITCTVEAPRFLFAGFAEGEVLGRVIYRHGDEILAEIPLQSASGVPTEQAHRSIFDRIRGLFRK